MTRKVIILWLCICGCQQKSDMEERKLAAYVKMETKVNSIITQLEIDCDSTIARMARSRAYSIMAKKIGGGKKK